MSSGPDDLRKGGQLFVWTLLGVGLAVLILFTILSMRMERSKHIEGTEEPSAPARRGEY